MIPRRYLPPLVRSIAAPGGRMMPSRSFGVERRTTVLAETDTVPVLWSPWLTVAPDELGPRMSSGPQRGEPTRHGQGTAYATPVGGWGLSGVATGWSLPGQANPSRPPTATLAIGRGWTPVAAGTAPTPSIPEPAQMVKPNYY